MNNTTESSRLESLLHKVQYDVRSIFYLLTPRETYYKNVNEVPDLTDNALEIFFSFILVEQIIHLLKNGRFGGKLNDAFSSLSAGIISALPYFFMRKIHFSTYEWVHKNFVIYEMPYDSILTYIVTFLFVDMMYYWFHRAAHEVNIFWGAHQTHHSAEEYNFTTALRQSVFQTYTSWFFYLPLAFFVPPSIFMVHSHLNLIYQFWIHTEIVDSIGTFGEFILNTPSHHRVHHGRNPYCIDKNYAGVLIIWDRMFGTFQAEKKDIQLAYGLVHPIQTFDPIYVQVFNYRYIFKRFFEAKNWNERFSVLFKGPGWEEGSPRLGFHEKLPEVQYPIKKYDKKLSYVLNLYALVHFIFLLVQFSTFAKESSRYPSLVLSLVVVFILFSLTSLGQIFDDKRTAFLLETIRCLALIILNAFHEDLIKRYLYSSDILHLLFTWLNIISFLYITSKAIYNLTNGNIDQDKKVKIN